MSYGLVNVAISEATKKTSRLSTTKAKTFFKGFDPFILIYERVAGIGPASSDWQPDVLPLYYTREQSERVQALLITAYYLFVC